MKFLITPAISLDAFSLTYVANPDQEGKGKSVKD